MARSVSLFENISDESHKSADQARVQLALQMGKVATDVVDIEYWRQGNLELNSTEAFNRRFRLRRDPLVCKSLHSIWQATLRSIQSTDSNAVTLNFSGYHTLFERIYRVLIDDYDQEDMEACIREDWDEDRKGRPELTREQLCDSLFELCDHWTPSIDNHACTR